MYLSLVSGWKPCLAKLTLLNKAVCGLKQAARSWNPKADQVLQGQGFRYFHDQPCVYIKISRGSFDDFYLLYSNEQDKAELFIMLNFHFKIKAVTLLSLNSYFCLKLPSPGHCWPLLQQKHMVITFLFKRLSIEWEVDHFVWMNTWVKEWKGILHTVLQIFTHIDGCNAFLTVINTIVCWIEPYFHYFSIFKSWDYPEYRPKLQRD